MEMKSGRGLQEDEDDDEEEFVSKRVGGGGGGSSQKDARGTEPKANTPRSKHSATEQRRRSKINDRFQILRDLIPQNDQKRDKASFLLEVIEYIQFLQEKVNKYEGTYQGWNQEPMKLTPWRNGHGHGHGESMIDHSRTIKNGPGPALIFSGKFEDSNIPVTPSMLGNTQTVIETDLSNNAYKPMDQLPVIADKVVLPIPMQTNMLNPIVRAGGLAQPPQMSISDAENMIAQPQSQLWQGRPCATEQPVTGEKLNEQLNEQEDMAIEGGTISIAGVYSQELLNNLTQALISSGVDLSQASISVQVDLGKRAISKLNAMTPSAKDHEDPSTIRAMEHSRAGSSGEDSDQAQKRLKSEK